MTDKNRDQITSGSTSAFSFKHSDASETSTNFTSTNNFYKPIDGSQKILNNLLNEIPNIKEQELKNQLILFASSFQNALLKSVNFSSVVEVLPPLTFFQEDDESILLEWIFSDFRIGFSFEFDKQKSNWYIIANKNLNSANASGEIDFEKIEGLVQGVIAFIAANT